MNRLFVLAIMCVPQMLLAQGVVPGTESVDKCPRARACSLSGESACLMEEAEGESDWSCLVQIVYGLEKIDRWDLVADVVQQVADRDEKLAEAVVNWGLAGSPATEAKRKDHAFTVWRVKFYLDRGASPDYSTDTSYPVLFRCASADNHECVRILLEAGADIDKAYDPSAARTIYQTKCFSIVSGLFRLSQPNSSSALNRVTESIATLMLLPERGQGEGVKEFCIKQLYGQGSPQGWQAAGWANWPLYLTKKAEEQSKNQGGKP